MPPRKTFSTLIGYAQDGDRQSRTAQSRPEVGGYSEVCNGERHAGRLFTKSASGVLAALRGSTDGRESASVCRSVKNREIVGWMV